MKFNVTHSILSVLTNPTEKEFINEFLKVGNNTCFVATNKRKLQCYVELKEQRPYRISVFQFNSLESEKHFSFSKISETILQTFMSKHSESLGFEKVNELVIDEAIEETQEDEVPSFEAEDCEYCRKNDEESGVEYERNVHSEYGTWYCDNCRRPV